MTLEPLVPGWRVAVLYYVDGFAFSGVAPYDFRVRLFIIVSGSDALKQDRPYVEQITQQFVPGIWPLARGLLRCNQSSGPGPAVSAIGCTTCRLYANVDWLRIADKPGVSVEAKPVRQLRIRSAREGIWNGNGM